MTENRAGLPIPDHIVKQAEHWLVDDEKLILVAQPDPFLMGCNLWMLFISCGGLIFGAILVFMTPSLLRSFNLMIACTQLVFFLLAVGAFLLPALAYRNAKHTIYGLTDKRAFISHGGGYPKSYGRRDITMLKIRELGNNKGDLIFATGGSGNNEIGFQAIPQPEEVRRLMIEVFEFDEADFWSN